VSQIFANCVGDLRLPTRKNADIKTRYFFITITKMSFFTVPGSSKIEKQRETIAREAPWVEK
jgi:hypothetical protein